jgi:hypothetical protein
MRRSARSLYPPPYATKDYFDPNEKWYHFRARWHRPVLLFFYRKVPEGQ